MCGHQVRQPVEPLDVTLEVAGFLEVLVASVQVVFGKGLDEFLRPDVGQFLQLYVGELLRHHQGTLAHLSDVDRLEGKEGGRVRV